MIRIIVAYAKKNRVIGNKGALPWSLKEDMAHFKATTLDNVVIMGSKTYDSLKMPFLPKRVNIVITRNPQKRQALYAATNPTAIDGPYFAGSLDEATRYAEFVHPKKEIYIIGGAEIYKLALENRKTFEVIASEVDGDFEGDVFFPDTFVGFEYSREQKTGFELVVYRQFAGG